MPKPTLKVTASGSSKASKLAGAKHVERVRKLCLNLPETSEKLSHGEPTFFVRKRVFAMCSINHHHDGHTGWVGIELPRISDRELAAHLNEAWKLIAPEKLHEML